MAAEIMELFTFGMLSRFYGDLKTADQKMIAQNLYNTTPKNIISWLHCCTDLRNICAHYGRLYYRIFPSVPGGLNILEPAKRRLWGCVLALRALYPDENKWNNEVVLELEALINEYLPDISLYRMAFPSDWSKKLRK